MPCTRSKLKGQNEALSHDRKTRHMSRTEQGIQLAATNHRHFGHREVLVKVIMIDLIVLCRVQQRYLQKCSEILRNK